MESFSEMNFVNNTEVLSHFLMNGLYTDCTFIVGEGDEQKHFKAHRLILSLRSPVLRAMCYGPVGQNLDAVHVPDIHPAIFEKFLNAIYTETVEPASFSEACLLFAAGYKYMLKNITEKCLAYMSLNLGPYNAAEAYEVFSLYDQEHLAETSMQIIRTETSKVLSSEAFTRLDKKTVLDILNEDCLGVESEAELYNAVYRWVEAEMRREGTSDDGRRRKLMSEFLPHIRFLSMSSQEFFRCMGQSAIFPGDEARDILWNIVDPLTAPELPKNISQQRRTLRPKKKEVINPPVAQPWSTFAPPATPTWSTFGSPISLTVNWTDRLINAAMRGDINDLSEVKSLGKDLLVRAKNGYSLLHYAVQEGHDACARWLLQQGLLVHHTSNEGWTPLHIAASCGRLETAQMLLDNGACRSARDRYGWTAEDYAVCKGHSEVADLLGCRT